MALNTLISTASLSQLAPEDYALFDCRFSLNDANAGCRAYYFNHITTAQYVHLINDLSAAIGNSTGRHPLPDFSLPAKKLCQWGATNTTQVVVYDDAGAALAGRMWWLLRCLGHNKVAVLNRGITQWQLENRELTTSTTIKHAPPIRIKFNS